MARRTFSTMATTHQESMGSRTIPTPREQSTRGPGIDVLGGPDRGARLDVMGHPDRVPGIGVIGGPDRGVRVDVMGHPSRVPGIDVMGGPDRGVRLDVMGRSDRRVLDSHREAGELSAAQEVKAMSARRDPMPQQPRRAA
jgi:hypothetical protein